VLRAAGETETAQENTQDRLELEEGVPELQSDRGTNCSSAFFFFSFIFIITACIMKFYVCFIIFFCLLGLYFASLIQIS
jgi:hypothetical protein